MSCKIHGQTTDTNADTAGIGRSLEASADSAVLAYSPQRAAEVSSLSVRKLMADIAAGKLRSHLKGRRRVILRADLLAYLRQ